jgi:excisionase family DNA binding protein
MLEKQLNIKQFAERIGIPLDTAYKLVQDGAAPNYKVGRHIRFDPSAVAAWIANGGTKSFKSGLYDVLDDVLAKSVTEPEAQS